MSFSSTRKSLSLLSVFSSLERPLAGLFIGLGLAVSSSSYVSAQAVELAKSHSVSSSQVAVAQGTVGYQTLPDGVYLYGQSSEAEQIGSSYMVFKVDDNQVVGAFYMPYSSFDCFQGEFQTDRLALNVVDSYEQVVHPYEVALQNDSSVASSEETAVPVGLEGYHRIQSLSDNDQRILATCQADFAQ